MSKKFKTELYNLALLLPGGKVEYVDIPRSNKGFQRKVVGGVSTYQMAIDSYTIKFSNKDELLNDIRNNNLANINNIPNNNIGVMIQYDKRSISDDSRNVAYKDSGLEEFIKNNNIGSNFYNIGSSYGTEAYQVISEFKKKAISLFFNNELSTYYGYYLDKINNLTSNRLNNSLRSYDDEEYLKNRRIFLRDERAFYEYENIRRHLMTDYRELELSFAQDRYNSSPFNERVEALKDFDEIIDSINKKYSDSFIDYNGPYTIDSEEEMYMLNNPYYEEDDTKSFKR